MHFSIFSIFLTQKSRRKCPFGHVLQQKQFIFRQKEVNKFMALNSSTSFELKITSQQVVRGLKSNCKLKKNIDKIFFYNLQFHNYYNVKTQFYVKKYYKCNTEQVY